jgi:hypothetical protein
MSDTILYNDAKAIWRFNSTWADAKGNHPITNTGATFDTSNKIYGSASAVWDGINDVGTIADHSDFNVNEFTYAQAAYFPNLNTYQNMISKHNPTSKTGYVIYFFSGGSFYFTMGNGSSWPAYDVGYAIGSTGWHHIVASHSLTSHKLYVDGYLRGSAGGGVVGLNTQDVWFGRDAGSGAYVAGQHDETVYLTRQITDGGVSVGQVAGGEVAELYANYLIGKELEPGVANGFPFFFDAGHY